MSSQTVDHEAQLQAALDQAARDRDSLVTIINATSDGLLLLDNNRRVVAANRRCAELFGVEYRDLLAWSAEEATAELASRCDAPAQHRAKLMRHFERPDEPYQDRLTFATPGKRILRRASSPAWHGGQVAGRVFTYTDITIEVELDQLKSDFVSMASHELRTPLTSIHGALQLALAGSGDRMAEEDRELLGISVASTERLSRLVDKMLDLSKIEAGRMPTDMRRLDAAMLLDETARVMHAHAATKNMPIAVVCEAHLEPIDGDRDLLLRVLTNLVSNALKYSPAGTRVTLAASRASDLSGAVEFAVEDEGPGIAPGQRVRLFQPFARVGAQTHERSGGTGLGLAISRAIVDQHGGRIWAEPNANGVGTRFAFLIPCACGQARTGGHWAVA